MRNSIFGLQLPISWYSLLSLNGPRSKAYCAMDALNGLRVVHGHADRISRPFEVTEGSCRRTQNTLPGGQSERSKAEHHTHTFFA